MFFMTGNPLSFQGTPLYQFPLSLGVLFMFLGVLNWYIGGTVYLPRSSVPSIWNQVDWLISGVLMSFLFLASAFFANYGNPLAHCPAVDAYAWTVLPLVAFLMVFGHVVMTLVRCRNIRIANAKTISVCTLGQWVWALYHLSWLGDVRNCRNELSSDETYLIFMLNMTIGMSIHGLVIIVHTFLRRLFMFAKAGSMKQFDIDYFADKKRPIE